VEYFSSGDDGMSSAAARGADVTAKTTCAGTDWKILKTRVAEACRQKSQAAPKRSGNSARQDCRTETHNGVQRSDHYDRVVRTEVPKGTRARNRYTRQERISAL
jgi:hypothetical protein